MNHFRDTQRAAGTSKLYDEWSLRSWMETILVSDGHCGCTPARVRRCRSIWKCPEDLRWVKRELSEMICDSWTTSPRQEERPTIAESSTTQLTTRSTIRETETGDKSRDKRQRVLASRPDRTRVDVNAYTCRTIVLAADPKFVMDGLSRLWIGTRNGLEPRVDILAIRR